MSDIHDRIASSFARQGLMGTLGAELLSAEEGEVRIARPFSTHLSQQQGFIHAGAITSIVDSACGYAALTKAPQGHEVVTAEFKLNPHPVIQQFLRGDAEGPFLTDPPPPKRSQSKVTHHVA